MFSRSAKTDEESIEHEVEEVPGEPKKRSPMLLAGLAGLLAIAGAFLLVQYMSGGDDAVATDEAVPTQQVLVVDRTIPAGTTVDELLAEPTRFLTAEARPQQFVAADAIKSVTELEELRGLTLSSDALGGEQLLRAKFIDRSDFDNGSFIERASSVKPPAGHHQVVLSLPSAQALGGNVRAGDKVSVISSFRVQPPEGDPYEVSVVVLPTIEVVNVDTDAEIVGEVTSEVDAVGIATIGDFAITVAVEPDELTDLTYAMKYGDIILAVALDDATKADVRPVSTIDTILADAEFNDESLADLLGLVGSTTTDDSGTTEEASDAAAEGES